MSKKIEIEKNTLKKLYCNKNKTLYSISKILKCSISTISRNLKKHNIKTKNLHFYYDFSSKNNPVFKGGKPHCLICGKKLSTRKCAYCQKHSQKITKRITINYCCMDCGALIHPQTALHGVGYCQKCRQKGQRSHNYGKTFGCFGKKSVYKNINFRSSWEANFAKWCDLSGIKWEYEPKAFELNINGKETTYTPDFCLPEFDCWIEIKGRLLNYAKKKIIQFKQDYNLFFKMFRYKQLKRMGIIYK